MIRGRLIGALLVVVGLAQIPPERSYAQTPQPPQAKSVLFGLEVAAVPDALYAQLPQLPKGQGLLLEQLGPEAPASMAKLNRHDVLLSYDGQVLRNAEQLSRLLRTAKPNMKAPLVVLRAGKEMTVNVSLSGVDLQALNAKSAVKSGGPPAVDVAYSLLDGGKLRVSLRYYSEATSKLKTLVCEGTLQEIERKVVEYQLEPRVQEIVDLAFKRLQTVKPK